MKYQALHSDFRSRLAALAAAVEASCAQGLTDLPKHAEDLAAGLLRELLGYRNVRNLNAEGNNQFPGLDLGDDEKRTGFQVTATASLEKVKDTLATVLRHRLEEMYPNIKVVVLTKKQASYSQAAINAVLGGRTQFSAAQDILDYNDLLHAATYASPVALRRALDVLDAYERGAVASFALADFDPPQVNETVELNLLELYFPSKLFVADLLDRPKPRSDGRKHVRDAAKAKGRLLPSDFEVHEGKLATFYNLEESNNPFDGLYDRGTLTSMSASAFADADANYERVFKSLLRCCLQEQLYRRHVHWRHHDKLFVFMPVSEDKWDRKEQWVGKTKSTRTVVLYRVSKKDANKGGFRHLAFQAEFLKADGAWLMAIRPDWYFSTNPNYRPSPIGPELLKGIKRLETNKSVEQHFRFLCWWLKQITEEDLLTARTGFLSFGDITTFDSHPALDDARWLPAPVDEASPEGVQDFEELMLDL